MNNASILAASLVLLVFGIILRRQSNRDKTIPNRGAIGGLLLIIGAGGIIFELVNLLMFVLFP